MHDRHPLACIVPPYLLRRLIESPERRVREAALRTLVTSTQLRARRSLLGRMPGAAGAGQKRRTIYDARHAEPDPPAGALVRGEGDQPSKDPMVNEAYDGLGLTYDFYSQTFGRNSLDGHGMRLDAVVHYGDSFNNAFWDGREMVFGDGDGELFTSFTKSLDVIAHELTHGVTEFSAGLDYHEQPGALNESMSDVFGSLVKQWAFKQDAAAADWLIGPEIFTPGTRGDALRSLKAPGEAYDNPVFGKDPQPRHMKDFHSLPDTRAGDNGGVHINSGIPNHAFYLAATAIGGHAWNAPGHIWYETLTKNCGPEAQFQDFADATCDVAGRLYGDSSTEQRAVRDAWRQVGIKVNGGAQAPPSTGSRSSSGLKPPDSLIALQRRINDLARTMSELASQRHPA